MPRHQDRESDFSAVTGEPGARRTRVRVSGFLGQRLVVTAGIMGIGLLLLTRGSKGLRDAQDQALTDADSGSSFLAFFLADADDPPVDLDDVQFRQRLAGVPSAGES